MAHEFVDQPIGAIALGTEAEYRIGQAVTERNHIAAGHTVCDICSGHLGRRNILQLRHRRDLRQERVFTSVVGSTVGIAGILIVKPAFSPYLHQYIDVEVLLIIAHDRHRQEQIRHLCSRRFIHTANRQLHFIERIVEEHDIHALAFGSLLIFQDLARIPELLVGWDGSVGIALGIRP